MYRGGTYNLFPKYKQFTMLSSRAGRKKEFQKVFIFLKTEKELLKCYVGDRRHKEREE